MVHDFSAKKKFRKNSSSIFNELKYTKVFGLKKRAKIQQQKKLENKNLKKVPL